MTIFCTIRIHWILHWITTTRIIPITVPHPDLDEPLQYNGPTSLKASDQIAPMILPRFSELYVALQYRDIYQYPTST